MLKQFLNLSINQTRNYAFKSNLKIKWIRPDKIPCVKPVKSGDLAAALKIAPDRVIHQLRDSKELLDCSDIVKQAFTVEYNYGKEKALIIRKDLVERVKRHASDSTTAEAKIATLTGRIRCLQDHIGDMPRDRQSNRICKELIDKRKKHLKYLRRWDYKRFEWILEKLDLEYKSPPPKYHRITRKESLVKLTDIHCEEIKAKKLEEYKKVLLEERERLGKELAGQM